MEDTIPMTIYTNPLNTDLNAVRTSADFGNPGDGTSKWYQWQRTANGGNAALGSTTSTAVTDPTATASLIAVAKGLLTFLRVSAAGIGKAEDTAHVTGDTGAAALAVRRDTAVGSAGTDGDYSTLSVDSLGRLRVIATSTPLALKASSVALANSLVVKASPGILHRIIATNSTATGVYLHLYNTTTLPADGAVPFLVYDLDGNNSVDLDFGPGISCGTGIVVGASSTVATKTLGAADCWFDVIYE
jgi:hypothetical protein